MKDSVMSRRQKIARMFVMTMPLSFPTLMAIAVTLAEPVTIPTTLRVEIAVRSRQFEPPRVTLRAGEKVTVAFTNRDAELHAFVPIRFLEYIPLHVDGNGAPQFNEKGLVRVLIPSGGRAEIQFVPERTGLYQYRCDLPGHQMFGEILVK